MMKIKKIFGFPTLMFIFVWGLLFLAGQSKMLRDPGSFSHASIGAYILDTSQLIYKDVFSFTRFGQPWIAQQWLGECFMAIIQRLAGFDGLLVVTVSLIALLYSYLALRIERSGMNLALGTFILMFSLAAEGKFSAVILFVLPFLAGLGLFFVNPAYMKELLYDPRGKIVIAISVGMMLLGLAIIKRIINIKI